MPPTYSLSVVAFQVGESVDAAKDVAMPKKAETHIQNSAPGPPMEIAPVTPKILPGPTRIAVESKKAVSEEIPLRVWLRCIPQGCARDNGGGVPPADCRRRH